MQRWEPGKRPRPSGYIVTKTYRCADTRRVGIRRAVGVTGEAKAVVGERLVKPHGDHTHDQSAFFGRTRLERLLPSLTRARSRSSAMSTGIAVARTPTFGTVA